MIEALSARKIKTGVVILSGALALTGGTYAEASSGVYHVSGTCTNGSCFVNERDAPSLRAKKIGKLKEGKSVDIICQERAGMVTAPDGTRGSVWDKIEAPKKPDDVAFVSDLFVSTPGVNHFSPGIPHCE
jgi:hypothetical protein